MFSKATAKARAYTRPIIVSVRYYDGTVEASVGTMFYVSPDGWACTASHILNSFAQFQADQKKIKEAAEMNAKNPGSVVLAPKTIVNHSIWLGQDQIRFSKLVVYRQFDVAFLKLENVRDITALPLFRDPRTFALGTSLCRFGYFLDTVPTEFHEDTKSFSIPKEAFPLHPIVLDTMHAQDPLVRTPDGKLSVQFIHLSTPALKGQSGGPVYDSEGKIYGMQIMDTSVNLKMASPVRKDDPNSPVENQFLNLGVAVHAGILTDLMKGLGIEFISDDSMPAVSAPRTPEKKPEARNGNPDVYVGSDGDKYIIE